jgi:flavin-dependent dehydrogenase
VKVDVVIAGGGPAGLAMGIHAAQRGLSTLVIERSAAPPDKACGEGVMPAGVGELEALGVLPLISPTECAPFRGIRYVQEDGTSAEGRLPAGGGLGIRRTALVDALACRARSAGAVLRDHSAVLSHRRTSRSMAIETDAGPLEAQILVAADGLASPLRHAEGLDGAAIKPRRFGLRQHFIRRPWTDFVEVHLSPGAEAYVTPVGPQRVGVAFLWEDRRLDKPISPDALRSRFPLLAEKLEGAKLESNVRAAGPLARASRARIADRFVLLGDAAGYVDAITGEGLSLAFTCAAALARVLPDALARGASRGALAPYERAFARQFRRYAWVTRAVLAASRRVRLRRQLIGFLSAHPKAFDAMLHWFAA